MTKVLWAQAQRDYPIELAKSVKEGTCFCKCGCRQPNALLTGLCRKCSRSKSYIHGPATASSLYNDLMDAYEAAGGAEDAGWDSDAPEQPKSADEAPSPSVEPSGPFGHVTMLVSTDFASGDYAVEDAEGHVFAMHIHRLWRFPVAIATVEGPRTSDDIRAHAREMVDALIANPAEARNTYTQLTQEGIDV